ncbi:MAG: hypothetical protein ACYDBX_04145 [Patescibacteria group bacterium]
MIKSLKKYNFIFGFLLFVPLNFIYASQLALVQGPIPSSPTVPAVNPPHLTGLVGVFSTVVGLLYAIVTLVLFVIVLINGFKYLFSGVNPDLKDQARKGLTYAFIGLAVIVLAYFIILLVGSFVAPNFTNSFVSGSTLQFNLNIPTQQ